MKKLLALGILLIITSCGCQDDGTDNFLLSEFENGIIPFQSTTSVLFIDENNDQFMGSYSEKQSEIIDLDIGDDESCSSTNIETQFIVLSIPDKSLNLEITLGKVRGNRTTFTIENIPEILSVENCSGLIENIEGKLTDVNIQGFEFNMIYDFNACEISDEIKRIIYSRNNGIEFIEFNNDSYLRLN
jgi:hypothetical protein